MKKYEHELNFNNIQFPVKCDDIPKFEKRNGLTVSVYCIKENGKQVYPLFITKRRNTEPINLLLIEEDEKSHYTWIKNMNRLLSYDTGNTKLFCPY